MYARSQPLPCTKNSNCLCCFLNKISFVSEVYFADIVAHHLKGHCIPFLCDLVCNLKNCHGTCMSCLQSLPSFLLQFLLLPTAFSHWGCHSLSVPSSFPLSNTPFPFPLCSFFHHPLQCSHPPFPFTHTHTHTTKKQDYAKEDQFSQAAAVILNLLQFYLIHHTEPAVTKSNSEAWNYRHIHTAGEWQGGGNTL